MIEKKKRYLSEYEAQSVIKEYKECTGEDSPTAYQVVEWMLESSRYTVHRYDDKLRKTLLNRINLLWFIPVYLLTVPIQWLVRGKVGVNRNSRIGKAVGRLIGFD